ncbi:MAG TPA: M6 family metalloprotease domain-containing protein [Gemmatimonadales bacterium]|nr:M6 family metalloprotease domain-containing protein [Gemmatimonadales bacterium]
MSPDRWWSGAARALVVSVVAMAPRAAAQDLELAAQMTGRALPAEYYQLLARDPDFFTLKRGWISRAQASRASGTAVSGTLSVAIVQALFSDSPEPHLAIAEVQRALFDGPATFGTLTDSYREMSGGLLNVSGQVLPWVRTGTSVAQAMGTSLGVGASVTPFLLQALALEDATADFGAFDNDGPDGVPNSGDDDGFVDALAFQYIETAASCGGPAPWPHRSRIASRAGAPFQTNDPRAGGGVIQIDDYIIQSTVTCDGSSLLTATVIAHELGHVLGLPDLYDASGGANPEQRIWVLGCWSLMAGGGWGCGNAAARTVADRPPHMGPWEKSQMGWLSEELVGPVRDAAFLLPPVASGGKVLKVPLSAREYLLMEYRPRSGFDQDLPLPGVLVYHVDEDRPVNRNASQPRLYRVALVEADGNNGLGRTAQEGGNRGEATDVFGGVLQRASNQGSPSTRLNTGAPSSVTLYRVDLADDAATVRLSTTVLPSTTVIGALLSDPARALSAAERAYLDEAGNRNGRFDVGDVRRYLREHPSALASRP